MIDDFRIVSIEFSNESDNVRFQNGIDPTILFKVVLLPSIVINSY